MPISTGWIEVVGKTKVEQRRLFVTIQKLVKLTPSDADNDVTNCNDDLSTINLIGEKLTSDQICSKTII